MIVHRSPADFADLVFQRLEGLSRPAPTQTELRDLVNVALYASLEREEGRPQRFAIGFLERSMLERERGSSYGGPRHWFPIAFRDERPFSVPLVAKLAVDPDGGMLAVVRNPQGLLSVGGIVGTGTNFYRELRREPTGGGHVVAGHLLLRVLAPGTIEASCQRQHIATFVRGQVFDDPPVGALSSQPILAELNASGRVERRAATGVLERLMLAALRRGHGATLVLTPTSDVGRDNGYQSAWNCLVLRDAYRFLQGALPTEALRSGGVLEVAGREGSSHSRSFDESRMRRIFEQQIDRWNFLDDAVSFVAELAALDGAVVLGPDLGVLGFGVKLDTHHPPPLSEVRLCLDHTASRSVEFGFGHLGTRHKSAIAFAHQHPRTVVLVVSGDGVVTSMLRPSPGKALLIWRPVTVGSDPSDWAAGSSRTRGTQATEDSVGS